MDVAKEDMKMVGLRKDDAVTAWEMSDLLWPPLKDTDPSRS